ncbi:MAG: FAD-dependent oxidoreductase, partial [Thermoanaerobaculia bacterium]
LHFFDIFPFFIYYKRMEIDFLKLLSHQLKSPINTTNSLLKSLLQGFFGEIPPQVKEIIEKALLKNEEAISLISDLIYYQSLTSGKELPKEEVEILNLLRKIHLEYQSEAMKKGLKFSLNLPERIKATGMLNLKSIKEAFKNIVENAIKYTPEKGEVLIYTSFSKNQKEINIYVEDTGPGIPQEEQEKIFEPFHRSKKTKAISSGTGLGLPLTKEIIKLHNGKISLKSQEGKGSIFCVSLPLSKIEKTAKVKKRKSILIIGGVTAGPKVASRLRRLKEDYAITVIEKSKFLSYVGSGIPSYISGKVSSPSFLQSTPDNTLRDVTFFENIKGIDVLNETKAVEIDREKKRVKVLNLKNNEEYFIPYDVLVLATGALSKVPDIDGIKSKKVYSLYNIEDAEKIKKELQEGGAKDVIIIGGGLVGVETSESLVESGARVTILEQDSSILLNYFDFEFAKKIERELSQKGIKILPGCKIIRIEELSGKLLVYTDKGVFSSDFIVLSAGVVPNVELAKKAGLEIGTTGGIKVNKNLKTSDPYIYAAGDCAESFHFITKKPAYWPLGSVSIKMGRIVADNIAGIKTTFKGSLGTTLFKIFDLTCARTGLTTRKAKEAGYEVISTIVSGLDKEHYSPGSQYIFLKVIADRKTKKLLGAQGIGKGMVSKRIQVLASSISCGTTFEDIFSLDLGYFPHFNTPIDICQNACLVLKNKYEGLFETLPQENFEKIKNMKILDVSPPQDNLISYFPQSLNIPLENLRAEEIPFPKEEEILILSRTSARAYEAFRFLKSSGYKNLYILEGGFIFWKDLINY